MVYKQEANKQQDCNRYNSPSKDRSWKASVFIENPTVADLTKLLAFLDQATGYNQNLHDF